MFVRTLQFFGKWLSNPFAHEQLKSNAGPRPQIEHLENRMLLSASSQALVAQMYHDLLQRPADAAGLANWTAILDQGTSAAQVALDFVQSPEGRSVQVQNLYEQFLHRAADPAGLDTFTKALASGQTQEQIAAAIAASLEYYQNRTGGSDSGFLDALYPDALNRQVDTSGAVSFGQALAGGTSRAQVAEMIFSSAEFQQNLVQQDYNYFLHRAADAAGLQNWTRFLQHGWRDEQIAAAVVGSPEYAQIVQLQQTLLPDSGNSSPVLVVNTPTQPVPVRDVNDVLQPVQIDLAKTGGYTVPKGKRLVIEDISAFAYAYGGDAQGGGIVLLLFTRLGNQPAPGAEHDIPVPLVFPNAFAAHELVRIYADPGTSLELGYTSYGQFGFSLTLTISGYLVDVPQVR